MGLYHVLRPLLFLMDPESAHEAAMNVIRRGWLQARPFHDARLMQTVFGLSFANPFGLAAGFDKNALALDQWHKHGFGFVEVGTVTAHGQPGNPKPRLFRLPDEGALINRLGFNNDGSARIATRVAQAKPQLPVGINLGKSKATELADAPADYQESYRRLHRFGAYFVVNVSSPNTPGLRSLQDVGPLREIFSALRDVDASRPLLVKVAPDLEDADLDAVAGLVDEMDLAGVVATNTTIRRDPLPPGHPLAGESGGLSGRPVRGMADRALARLHAAFGGRRVLIGVGGVQSGTDAFRKVALGAHLVQGYTGWVYGGPHWVPELLEEFAGLMDRHGLKSLEEFRGTGPQAFGL